LEPLGGEATDGKAPACGYGGRVTIEALFARSSFRPGRRRQGLVVVVEFRFNV
jgi:hypothetical protein